MIFRVSPGLASLGISILAVVVVGSTPFSVLFKTPSLLVSSVIVTVGAGVVVVSNLTLSLLSGLSLPIGLVIVADTLETFPFSTGTVLSAVLLSII